MLTTTGGVGRFGILQALLEPLDLFVDGPYVGMGIGVIQ
jgi:hypothetical protein